MTIYSWVGAATRYLLLKRGVVSNTKISRIENEVLQGEAWLRLNLLSAIMRWLTLAYIYLLYSRDTVLAVDWLDFG